MYNSTETSNVKTRHKNNEHWIYYNTCIYPNFLLSSSDFMQSRSGALCQKVKRPWRQVWILCLSSRVPLTLGFRVLFWMRIIWKSTAIILSKRNMAEKDVCCIHTLHCLDCKCSFCMEFLHHWWLLKVKKNRLSPSSLSSLFITFLFFGLKYWVVKLNLRLRFDLR